MTLANVVRGGTTAAIKSLRSSRRRAAEAPAPAPSDVKQARTLGRNFAKTCLDLAHPRVMTTEWEFQQLRDLRNHVRHTAPGALGDFNRDREAPLYEAFLAGILDHALAKGYIRSHKLSQDRS